jgi:hypothetical protein
VSSSSQLQQRAVWGWGSTFDAEEARSFLAQRVALYARLIGLFFSLLYGAGIVLVLVAGADLGGPLAPLRRSISRPRR